jgi:endonuclease YncB( thermonuclease family)
VSAPVPSYAYKASYLSGHDGDSFWLRVDRGILTHGIKDDPSWYVRLFGIDTWEISGPKHPLDMDRSKGFAAAQATHQWLKAAKEIIIQTIHPDDRPPDLEKYGRVLARVWVDGQLLSDMLRRDGHEKVIA